MTTTGFDPNAAPDFGAGVVITSTNQFSGAGFLDSYTFLIRSCNDIKTADDSDKAALGAAIGLGVIASAVDTVKLAINPLGSLISAGLGWLIEHVSFLREPLDMLMGDPDEIQKLGEEVHKIAESIRKIGEDQTKSLEGAVSSWTGSGADAFNNRMKELAADLESKAHGTDIVGYVIHTNMAIISAVRGLFRDLITTVLGDIISAVLIAMATAVITFGASIVAAVTYSVTQATLTATSLASKLAAVVAQATRSGARTQQLVNLLKTRQTLQNRPIELPERPPTSRPASPAPSSSTYHTADDGASVHSGTTTSSYHTADDGASVHSGSSSSYHTAADDIAPPPKGPWTKTHEEWLKTKMPDAWSKYKKIENELRDNHPESFKVFKQWIADSDNAKEYWAWPIKATQDSVRQLLDIQKSAEASWTAEQQEQQA
ncbi:hypothetical protein GCM10027445_24610 [Amycolatopsis endophytica]|uniref:Uncharacterized protein YukE n=1 Tax=Amycolatopsis endophytica TaxID=860233 RepID=A0A853BDD4_9PSEU|nr:hypothetical protein [Amycolatopsis endophytica]NYI92446.1 uncharacterized protein YukE [Amycolatopsis endophytica]